MVCLMADHLNHRLSLWRLGDGTVWKHLGSRGREPGQFTFPQAVAVTGAGALVVADVCRVQVIQAELNVPIPSKGLAAFPRHSGVNIIHAHYGHDFLNPVLVRDSLECIDHAKLHMFSQSGTA